MSFANTLISLDHAAEAGQRGMPKDRVNVSQRELRDLLHHFRRVDGEFRSYHAAAETEREKRIKATDALAAAQALNATLAAGLAEAVAWINEILMDDGVPEDQRATDLADLRALLSAPSAAAEVLDRVRAEGFAQGVEAVAAMLEKKMTPGESVFFAAAISGLREQNALAIRALGGKEGA